MAWYFVYNLAIPAGYVACTLFPAQESTLLLTGPLGQVSEIGTFSHKLEDAEVSPAKKAINASGYTTLPPTPPVPPETPMLTVGEGTYGEMPTLKAFSLPKLPGALKPMMSEMDKVIAALRAHPHHVVRGEARWLSPSFAPGQPLKVRVRLTNPGTAPAELYHPAGPQGLQRAPVVLKIGKDLPPGKLNPARDVREVDVPAASIAQYDPKGKPPPPAETMTIDPGATLELDLTHKAFLSPGAYRGTVTILWAQGDVDPSRAVYGALHMKIGPVQIKEVP